MNLTVCSMGFGARTGTAGIVTMGFGTGGATVATQGTPGRRVHAFRHQRDETDEEQRARRNVERTLGLTPDTAGRSANEILALERTAEYLQKSHGMAAALQTLREERGTLLARAAELDAMQSARKSAKVAAELLRQHQALQMQAIQERSESTRLNSSHRCLSRMPSSA